MNISACPIHFFIKFYVIDLELQDVPEEIREDTDITNNRHQLSENVRL
jgi:hypothetical protein